MKSILVVALWGMVWARPVAPIIPDGLGYVAIPNAAVQPDPSRTYRAILNAQYANKEPVQAVPAVLMAGGVLNTLGANGVPPGNVKLAIIFHDGTTDAVLDDAHYRARYHVANPNLKLLSELKKHGVELFICGQTLARMRIDPQWVSPDVKVASSATMVLMTYQNDGYALLSF